MGGENNTELSLRLVRQREREEEVENPKSEHF